MVKTSKQVYAIRHDHTKKMYIGSSSNVRRRYQQHLNALRKGRHPVPDMQADFDKFGGEYTLIVLSDITTDSERELEYGWMLRYGTYDRGYGYNYRDPAMVRQAADGSLWRSPDILERITGRKAYEPSSTA